MAKRLTDKQKEEILRSFKNGETIEDLSKVFNCSALTISRNLKKNLGESIYKKLISKTKKFKEKNLLKTIKENESELIVNNYLNEIPKAKNLNSTQSETNLFPSSEFMEIAPVDFEIEDDSRKEFSSIALKDIEFPKNVYMIVDKNIELEVKLLKDFPQWEFLPHEDLNRKTINIFFNLKIAKSVCKKDQKVIKVPNTDVFRIVSPILISRGISRIVSEDKLIAL